MLDTARAYYSFNQYIVERRRRLDQQQQTMADNTVIGGGNPAAGAGNTAVPGGTGTGAAQASNLGELRRRLSLIAQQQGNAGAQAGGTGTVIPPAQAALAAAAPAGGAGNAAGATLTAIEIQARIASPSKCTCEIALHRRGKGGRGGCEWRGVLGCALLGVVWLSEQPTERADGQER